MKRTLLCFLAAVTLLRADALFVPNLTVLGTDSASGLGFDNGGPTFTVSGDFLGTDTLSLMVNGTVDLAVGGFTANAAGIIIGPDPTNTGGHPGQVTPNSGNSALNYAALLIGNSTLGFFQVFPSSAEFGLGNPSPPTALTLTDRTLSDIGFVSGLSNGTVLELRVSDINFGDNSGAFNITQGAEVPEPGTTAMLILFLGGMAVAHRRVSKRLS